MLNDLARGMRLIPEKTGGLEGRTRPLAGPLSPRGPQPTLAILKGNVSVLNGPMAPKKGYRGRGTEALGGLVELPSAHLEGGTVTAAFRWL